MLALDSLSDFFRPGLSPDALPALNRLSAAWPYLAVFVTLFRGGDEEVLKDGSTIHDTQSSLVLEDLIGKFLLNSVNKDQANQ